MQRPQDTIGSGRWFGLLGVSALAMLAGCDWISGSTPIGPPPRPGVERDIAPVSALPPAPGNRQYDAPVTAADGVGSAPTIGSIISGKGGQKAQKEALEKEQAERDRKDREARDERDAADKEAKKKEKEQEQGAPRAVPVTAPVGAPPADAGSITSEPPISAPVAPPAPVNAAPIAPPSAAPGSATPDAPLPVPTVPTPSGDPNKAFAPPPGWTPPGATEGSVTTGVPPAAAPQPLPTPAPPADPNKAFAPQPGWVPPGTNVGSVMTLAPLTVAFTTPSAGRDDACGEPGTTTAAKGNIARAQSGEVPFSDLKSPPFDRTIQVAVIQFSHASSGLDDTDSAVLARVAEIQRENGGTVRIVAHAAQDVVAASTAGLERGNFDVSRRRALAIAQQLRQLGVPVGGMVAEAASDDEPIYQTNTARGLAANRRADIYLDF